MFNFPCFNFNSYFDRIHQFNLLEAQTTLIHAGGSSDPFWKEEPIGFL